MKKLLLAIPLLTLSLSSFASIIGLNFESGHKEWDATHTHTECVGRGICKFSITVGAFDASFSDHASIIKNSNDQIVIVLPSDYVQAHPNDFEGNTWEVNDDLIIPSEASAELGLTGELRFPQGVYRTSLERETGNMLVYLN